MIHKLACIFQIRRDAETDLLFTDRIRMCQKGGCSGKKSFISKVLFGRLHIVQNTL